jgi:16S rRNA (cytidine1402-2'-O)-methyltransferase
MKNLAGQNREAIAHYSEREPQGEFTLVVAGLPPVKPQLSEAELKAELQQVMAQGYRAHKPAVK